jgi:hypothetical protein
MKPGTRKSVLLTTDFSSISEMMCEYSRYIAEPKLEAEWTSLINYKNWLNTESWKTYF